MSPAPRLSHARLAQVVAAGHAGDLGWVSGVAWWVAREAGVVIVSFRGTAGGWRAWRDWSRNLLALPYRSPRAPWGHFGWVRTAERALVDGLARDLQQRHGRDAPYVLTGHSKGVESQPFADILHSLGFNVVEWVGFGTPKMWFSGQTPPYRATQYAFADDLVTKMVPFLRRRGKLVVLPAQRRVPSLRRHRLSHYIPYVAAYEAGMRGKQRA